MYLVMTIHPSSSDIYTVGHSNAPIERIIGLLMQYQIQMLVDVRSIPYSQYTPQFNRETLSKALEESGIQYTFAGEYLGGRPKDPTCYRDGQLPTGKADYLQLVDYREVTKRPWFQKGIARLMEIAHERTTAILCSEEDPYRCHRHHLIARTLLAEGVTIWHIRANGDKVRARSTAEPQAEVQEARQLVMFSEGTL